MVCNYEKVGWCPIAFWFIVYLPSWSFWSQFSRYQFNWSSIIKCMIVRFVPNSSLNIEMGLHDAVLRQMSNFDKKDGKIGYFEFFIQISLEAFKKLGKLKNRLCAPISDLSVDVWILKIVWELSPWQCFYKISNIALFSLYPWILVYDTVAFLEFLPSVFKLSIWLK